MYELLREKLQQLGYPPNLFGVHSLQDDGATATDNAGVPDHLFKRHGHYHSEGVKDGHVDGSLECCLSVSRRLEMWGSLYTLPTLCDSYGY